MATNLDLSFLDNLKSQIEYLKVRELTVDPEIQRPLDPNKVLRIFNEFTPGGVGTLSVSRRADGSEVILDGQHRHNVLLKKLPEGGPEQVRCEVFEGLTRKQEAALFLTLNNTTKPRAVDKFKVAGTAGDTNAVAITDILQTRGFSVQHDMGEGHVSAVATLERIYKTSVKAKREPNTLDLVLVIVERSWGYDRYGTKGVILEGLAAMIEEYGSKLVVTDLIERLREFKGGPRALASEAKQLAGLKGLRPQMAVAEILVEFYNKKFRSEKKQLMTWRRRR